MDDNKKLMKALNELGIKGLRGFIIIGSPQKEFIVRSEEKRNIGVNESLKRKYTICCLHDSFFREPLGNITQKNEAGEIYFPGLPFPEMARLQINENKAKNIVSGSPSVRVNSYLNNIYSIRGIKVREDEATIIIGFD